MKHPEIHAVLDEVLEGGAAHRLPELPNFGLFYLSIPDAASLIVEDLKRNNRRVTFGMYEDAEGTPEEREKNFKQGVATLTSDLQSRLLYAVRHGKVRSFSKSRTLEDFLQRGDEEHLPELTFIHYTDLVAWLTQFGYIDRLNFTERPAFEEYERNELDLLEHLEEDVKVRRHLIGKRIQSPLRTLAPPASGEDAHLQIQEQLAAALASIRELKQENQKLLISAEETRFAPLDENSKRSYVRLIAALCKKAGLDPNGSGTVGKITDASHELGKPVSNSTVLKLMVQVDDELTGKLRERAAAPGAAERKGARVERRKRSKEI